MRLAEIVIVIPLVDPHLTMIDLEDPVDQLAEEVAVVADQHHRAGKLPEASRRISRDLMSRWLVGSSSTRKLTGRASRVARTTRLFSPPERFSTRFSTASPWNRNAPSRFRITPIFARGIASCTVSNTVCLGSRISMACWLK